MVAKGGGLSVVHWLLLLGLTAVTGCDGCRREVDDQDAKKSELSPITRDVFRVQPSEGETSANRFKPGHWGVGSLRARANLDDLRGEMVSRSVSAEGMPLSVNDTGVGISVRRPLVLPKGQAKYLQTRFLLPHKQSASERRPMLENRILIAGMDVEGGSGMDPIADLQPQEYLFTVLSNRVDAWSFLAATDWTELPSEEAFEDNKVRWQTVVRPSGRDLDYLPDTMLAWTSTSTVLWDDLRPDQLTPEIQRALIDWLHWGGKLIVNGTAAADQLRGPAWEAILPLSDLKLTEIPENGLNELVTNWTIQGDESGIELSRKINAIGSLAGASGNPVPDAQAVANTGEMVWRRRVGRGMVILTRFDLSSSWLSQWRSASAFLNGAILQLPTRRWNDEFTQIFLTNDYRQHERDPAVVSNVRLFSRDASLGQALATGDDRQEGWAPGRGGSLGEWSNESSMVNAAMEQLRNASGITIPKREFVMRSIGTYLLILIPANFFLFWVMGRVELAWLLAPLIGLLGAAWVTRSAQLDIGFARSLNELSILELQPEHTRGHLTRVLAIYNSLSTNYRLKAATDEALLGPAIKPLERAGVREALDSIELSYGFAEGMEARGLAVPSNRTLMFHAEQMIDLPGGLQRIENQVMNATALNFEDVSIWENRGGELRVAVVGPLAAGGTVSLNFRPASEFQGWQPSKLGADQLMSTIQRMGCLSTGSSRFIGRVDGAIAGMEIAPVTSQVTAQTVVVAHLGYGTMPKNEPDQNIRPRGKVKRELFLEE